MISGQQNHHARRTTAPEKGREPEWLAAGFLRFMMANDVFQGRGQPRAFLPNRDATYGLQRLRVHYPAVELQHKLIGDVDCAGKRLADRLH